MTSKVLTRRNTCQGHAWKTYTLRQDFFPCSKLQTEDDITASVVVPSDKLKGKNFREQVWRKEPF